MKKIIFSIGIVLGIIGFVPHVFAAVAFDSAAQGSGATDSFTNTSGNYLLVTELGDVASVSYGGSAMTQLDREYNAAQSYWTTFWGLANPPTGSHAFSVSGFGGAWAAESYTGVVSVGATSTRYFGTTPADGFIVTSTMALTSDWLAGFVWNNNALNVATTSPRTSNRTNFVAAQGMMIDSNGPVVTAGTYQGFYGIGASYSVGGVGYGAIGSIIELSGSDLTQILSITYPADSTSLSDFSQWHVSFVNSGTANLSLGIRWGTTSTPASMENVDYLPYSQQWNAGTHDISVPKNTALQSNTTYWAEAFNLDSPYETSPVISFNTGAITYTLNTNPPSVFPFPSSTNGISQATTSPFYVDCSGYAGGFFSSSTLDGLGCEAQKVGLAIIGFLVVPPQWASQSLSGSFQNVLNAFPFSIPNTIVTNIQNSATSTNSAGENLTLSYLNFDQNGTTSYTLFTPTTLQDDFQVGICNATCASQTKNTIFDILTAIIWVLTAFAILKIL